eukprot:jgi/Mesen1/7576/ME000392S06844
MAEVSSPSVLHGWSWSTEKQQPPTASMTRCCMEVTICIVLGILGGVLVGAGHSILEYIWFNLLVGLEKRGKIKRLAPAIPVTFTELKQESFWAVTISHIPLFIGLAAFRREFVERAVPVVDPLKWWTFTWIVMVLHDLWFWLVHSLLHHFKALYRLVHQWHHSTKGDLTVYATAYGDALDLAFVFSSFYAVVMAYLYHQPKWDPLGFFALAYAFNGVDMMGHCGYELPIWVFGPGSLGILLTPLAQRTKHHYIHHLDPRFNRSLYFTWWDRLAGTFRDHHPKIVEGSLPSLT